MVKSFTNFNSFLQQDEETDIKSTSLPTLGTNIAATTLKQLSTVGQDKAKIFETDVQTRGPSDDILGANVVRGNLRKTLDSLPQVFSKESVPASFETFFHDFDLLAFPVYNYWTKDETTNETNVLGNKKLEDLPRYIRLSWKIAPEVKTIEDHLLDVKSKDKRDIMPVIFGNEMDRPVTATAAGMEFVPEILQTDGFDRAKNMTANGFMNPGAIEAVVEVNRSDVIDESPSPIGKFVVDEDAFLLSEKMAGLSVHELMGQVIQSSLGISSVSNQAVSAENSKSKDSMFDAQFIIKNPLEVGDKMTIQGVQPSSPSISMEISTATPSRQAWDDPVIDLMKSISIPPESAPDPTAQIKVKFMDPAIAGLVKIEKVNSIRTPEQAENVLAIAQHLPNLEILANSTIIESRLNSDVPSVSTPKLKSMEYIGYVIEKYKRGASGLFSKVQEISIPKREVDSYVDTKVAYGQVYRYRIKAIARWNRPDGITKDGPDQNTIPRNGSQTERHASYKSSFFSSEWGKKWAYGSCIDTQPPDPPDELNVLPRSNKKDVLISFKLPDNWQRDIASMKLLRKVRTATGESQWAVVKDESFEDIEFPSSAVGFIDKDVDFFQNSGKMYIYSAVCIGMRGEVSYLAEQLGVRLNSDYLVTGEFPVQFISNAGVRKEYFGAFSVRPPLPTRTEIIMKPSRETGVASLRVSARVDSGQAMRDPKDYVIRLWSLDTGESIDVNTQVSYRNSPTKQVSSENDIFRFNKKDFWKRNFNGRK